MSSIKRSSSNIRHRLCHRQINFNGFSHQGYDEECRDLRSQSIGKNIQARLGLVEYERAQVKLNTMISMDLSSQVIQKVSFLL